MREQILIFTLVAGLIFNVTASSGGAGQLQSLPGTKGPLYEVVGGDTIKILGVDIGLDMKDAKPEKPPLHRVFPSGTKELHVAVRFERRPAAAKFSIEVYNQNGKVTRGTGMLGYEENLKTGEFIVRADLNPQAGPFADGPYQAKIKLDDKIVALSIGKSVRPDNEPVPNGVRALLFSQGRRTLTLASFADEAACG